MIPNVSEIASDPKLDADPPPQGVKLACRNTTERMRWHLAAADRLFMDETTAPVLDPGAARSRRASSGRLRPDDRGHAGQGPPIVLFDYAPGRSGEHAERFLLGFRGQFLQVGL